MLTRSCLVVSRLRTVTVSLDAPSSVSKYYNNAERRTYFVLPSVTFSDITVVVPHNRTEFFLKHRVDSASFFYEFRLILEKRANRHLNWG